MISLQKRGENIDLWFGLVWFSLWFMSSLGTLSLKKLETKPSCQINYLNWEMSLLSRRQVSPCQTLT